MSRRVPVAGVPIDPISTPELLNRVAMAVATRTVTTIATVNAEYVARAHRDDRFRRLLERTGINTADGFGIVWALRRRGIPIDSRVGGSDLIWSIPQQSSVLGHRIFLLGAGPGIAELVAKRLRASFPGLVVAGTLEGSPSPAEDAGIVDFIRHSRADILFVAFGAPEQDYWIERNVGRTGASVCMGVGGSFDYVAGIAVRAPIWMRERGLEWLWRLLRQPSRWYRMLALPRFMWLAWRAEASEAAERTVR